jgi:drug/metabolite transporter (DMT)-like permease
MINRDIFTTLTYHHTTPLQPGTCTNMPNQPRAYFFAIVTVLFWSTVATAFKFTLEYLDIFQLLFYACLASVATLALFVSIRGRLSDVIPTFRQHWKITLIAGGLNPALYYLILFEAYDRLPAQVAQPINYTWAITLTFMSIIFLKQKITFADIFAALICYTGVVLIATQGNFSGFVESDLLGVGLALISTVIWAGYWILNVSDPRDPIVGMFLNFLVALPIVAGLCHLFSGFAIPMTGLFGAVYVGLFEMSLAFLSWSVALRLTNNTSRISNLIFLSPFLSLVFINRILGESIYPTTYIGLVIIVVGLLFQQWSHATRQNQL